MEENRMEEPAAPETPDETPQAAPPAAETAETPDSADTEQTENAGDGETGEEAPEKKASLGTAIYLTLHDFVYMFAGIIIVFVFAIRLVGVDGDSMYPTLHHGDFLCLLSNALYQDVKAGDIIVVTREYGEFGGEPIVKRVIATGGQTVDIDFEEGIVYVDGEPLDEPYINEPTHLSYYDTGDGIEYPVTVGENELFVMGDNRNHSADSRYAPLGQVSKDEVLGKVLFLLIPGKGSRNGYEDCNERDFRRIGVVS